MLVCADASYYIGITNNIEKRLNTHKKGKGGSYTRSHTPLRVVYSEELRDKSSALKREYALKKLTHNQKTLLTLSHS